MESRTRSSHANVNRTMPLLGPQHESCEGGGFQVWISAFVPAGTIFPANNYGFQRKSPRARTKIESAPFRPHRQKATWPGEARVAVIVHKGSK